MKKIYLILMLLFSHQLFSQTNSSSGTSNFWKLGVALYTFHTVNLPDELSVVDSTGLKYIEGFNFGNAGPAFHDSVISQLTPEQITQMTALIQSHGLKMESIYLAGGYDLAGWEKQFRIAKQLKVKFVTTEPQMNMLDEIDKLAGKYGIKVAIHNHWKGNSQYWSPDSVLAALKNHPNFGVCADLGHWPKSGLDVVESLKKLQGHLISIHLKDIASANNPKLTDVPVGTGIVDFPAVFRELERQKFDGYIYIERDTQDKPSNLSSVIQTVKYYQTQLALLKK